MATLRERYPDLFYKTCPSGCGSRVDKRTTACRPCRTQAALERKVQRSPEQREEARVQRNAFNRNYYALTKPVRRESRRRSYSKHRDALLVKARMRHLFRLYGLTPEAFQTLLTSQEGLCALCARVLSDRRRAHVDHCHQTGRIRGLLCISCNHALGMLGDTPEGLAKALAYVRGETL